jgi:L-Lysine epsilon oxidase N-terminal/L-lysine epsilon oxidase C-terminal domain
MAEYKVFPAIGVARVGNAPAQFYIGPETYRGLPINPDGRPFTEADFRDREGRLCRQAARFRVYRIEDGRVEEITLGSPGIKSIAWTVHLANKKPSWYTFETSLGEDGYAPNHPLRNAAAPDRHKLIIDAGPRTVSGAAVRDVSFSRASVPPGYRGAHFPEGPLHPLELPIDSLGELATDPDGRLLVLGGLGISGSTDANPVIKEYANNDNWWDDTADGPVAARIEFAEGAAVEAAPAWVLVAPPSYAPQIPNLVTLYDTIFDASVRAGQVPAIFRNGFWNAGKDGYRPNFRTDIRPLLERAGLYPWVAAIPPKPHDFDFGRLGMLGDDGTGRAEFAGLRRYVLDFVRPPDGENVIIGTNGATMMPYLAGDNCLIPGHAPNKYLRLTDTQYFFLQQWAEGWFGDAGGASNPADALSRAVLDNCVGGAFSPGIEMTWIARNQSIYDEPFRIRAHFVPNGPLSLDFDPRRGMEPGDVTRYMAVPWQADFNECSSQPIDGRTLWWWPAQRPEFVYLAPEPRGRVAAVPPPDESTGRQVAWIGSDFDQLGADFIAFADDVDMVKYWDRLGFVLEKDIDGKRRFVEVSRTLPRSLPDVTG